MISWHRFLRRRLKRKAFALLSLICVLAVGHWFLKELNSRNPGDIIPIHPGLLNGSTVPVILWWEAVPGTKDGTVTCSNVVCEVSTNKSRKGEKGVMVYSFYGSQLKAHDLPVPRSLGDIWSLIHEESPKNNRFLFSNLEILELFNITATFKRQSTFPLTTFGLREVDKIMDKKYLVDLETKNDYRKSGLAPIVYVQTNCDAPSDRDRLVTMLQKFIPIDSYGKCVNNKRFPKSLSFDSVGSMSPMESDEFYKFLSRYKFALAFENAICDDYVTEKFWRPIQLGVVPIVFGSPTIKDFLPDENAAVLTSDYASVGDLAKRIHFLDSHDDEYIKATQFKDKGIKNTKLLELLKRRTWGRGKPHPDLFSGYTCFLCETIHDILRDPSSFYRGKYQDVSLDHYGCPEPKRFSANGTYTYVDKWWSQEWTFSKYIAMAARHFYDQGLKVKEKQMYDFAENLYRITNKS